MLTGLAFDIDDIAIKWIVSEFNTQLMSNLLYDYRVHDRQTFIKFLDLLRRDLLNNQTEWENKTLPEFLEALSAYTEDVQGYYENQKLDVDADIPTWQLFADLFKGAKIYE